MAGSLGDRLLGVVARHRLAATLWLSLLLAVPAVVVLKHQRPPLPIYARLPAWELTDQDGHAFGAAQLRGRVWVADFMFTSCPSICPELTRHLGAVQTRTASLGDRLHIVSISVDPVVDTPARLTEYAHRHGADPARWHFVTGTAPALQHLAADGFRTALGEVPTSAEGRPETFNILHSARVMLIDGDGRMRGVYRTDGEGMSDLLRDAARLTGR